MPRVVQGCVSASSLGREAIPNWNFALPCLPAFAAEKMPLPTAHTTRNIEGWTVRVDDRLLHGEGALVGERALTTNR